MTRAEQRQRARAMFKDMLAGATYEETAEEYGMTVTAVKQLWRGHNYPDIFRELTGKEPKSTRKSTTDAPTDAMIHRAHELKSQGKDVSFIATTCVMRQRTVNQYLSGRRRKDIWKQYNNRHGDGLLKRAWGPATKPGGEVVVLNEAA